MGEGGDGGRGWGGGAGGGVSGGARRDGFDEQLPIIRRSPHLPSGASLAES